MQHVSGEIREIRFGLGRGGSLFYRTTHDEAQQRRALAKSALKNLWNAKSKTGNLLTAGGRRVGSNLWESGNKLIGGDPFVMLEYGRKFHKLGDSSERGKESTRR